MPPSQKVSRGGAPLPGALRTGVTFSAASPAVDAASPTKEGEVSPRFSPDSPEWQSDAARDEARHAARGAADGAGREKVSAQADTVQNETEEKKRAPAWRRNVLVQRIAAHLAWIPANVTSWAKLKPVARSALAAWVLMVMIMINPVNRTLGQAAFLVLISSGLQAADAPLASVVEREIWLLFLCTLAWAWSCIAIAIANSVRHQKLTMAEIPDLLAVYRGDYIELKPSIVCAVFQSFGCAMYLWIKASFGPSPLLFGSVLGCLTMSLSLSTAAMYPFAFYAVGKVLLIPLAVKSAVTIIISCFFFPKSNNALFCERIVAILGPVRAAVETQLVMFDKSPLEPDFPFESVQQQIARGEATMPLLQISSRLLKREITVGHASGQDLKDMEILVRKIFPALDAMAAYFRSVKSDITYAPAIETRSPSTMPAPLSSYLPSPSASRNASPVGTPLHGSSRAASPAQTPTHDPAGAGGENDYFPDMSRADQQHRVLSDQPGPDTGGLHDLLHHVLRPRRSEDGISSHHQHRHRSRSHLRSRLTGSRSSSPASGRHRYHKAPPVGTWESLRFSSVEAYMHPESSNQYTEEIMAQLGLSEKALLAETVEALADYRKATKRLLASAGELREVADALEAVRDDFEKHRRLLVLSPLLDAEGEFDPNAMPHRYIYQAFSHQFALLELSRHVLRLLRKAELVTNDRKISRIWFPDLSYMRRLEAWMGGTGDDEDGHELGDSQMEADMAQMHAFDALELSAGAPRNPDALEPETFVQWTGQRVWTGTQWLFTSNRLFVWKAGFLTALVSLPLYYRASAAFCYEQKAVWASFMFQLTLSRWRGDTFYGTWVRVIATALGACFGGIMWYISSGSGQGNVWGMGVTTAVAFPMLYFFRQYSPFSPPLKLVCVVTAFLVLGYSWQDTHFPSPGVLTYGANIMWRRLVLVLIGLGAALVGSYLPPSHTLRVYQRKGHAACIAELTKLTSSVLTWGAIHPNPDRVPEDDPERVQLTKSLINLRSKIRRLQAISPNTAYEVSFLGRWPAERYKELNEALLDAVKNLTYAYNVLKLQPGPWARAQFKRMRLSDPRFVGDMFAVVHMASTSLGGGKPMPHITPAPLLDRLFTLKNGFDIVSSFDYEENEEIFTVLDLPQHLDRATLENIDYFLYAVGATSWTSFILRLDRIALAIKELCGEAYMVPLHVVEQPDVKSLFTKLEELRKLQRATELAIKKAQ